MGRSPTFTLDWKVPPTFRRRRSAYPHHPFRTGPSALGHERTTHSKWANRFVGSKADWCGWDGQVHWYQQFGVTVGRGQV